MRLTESLVTSLERAHSFGQANELVALVNDPEVPVTREQLGRLRRAQAENRQVGEAFDVEHHLSEIEKRLGVETAASETEEEEPPF